LSKFGQEHGTSAATMAAAVNLEVLQRLATVMQNPLAKSLSELFAVKLRNWQHATSFLTNN
jgi:hypothetical protein